MKTNIPPLARAQRLFQDGLLHDAPGAEAMLLADAKADAATRLNVYADAYRLRLLEVLGNDYPTLRAVAGAETFEHMGRAYIETHPSDTPSVRWFGRHLPGFLQESRGWPRHELLAGIAAFEWGKGEVFDAPEAEPLELAAVAAVPPESWPEMRLLLQPALRRLDLRWNVPELFQAQDTERSLPEPVAQDQAVHWLLWRDAALDIRWRSLGEDEAAALDAVLSGASFGAICDALCQWVEAEEAAMHAAGLLKRWVCDGLVVELEGVG
ncbi:MAG: putative DNA-binding domain-containing protein [Nevskia sp.]|nr:putative DNA-binding domain-containing protein [Nevskia sp.]